METLPSTTIIFHKESVINNMVSNLKTGTIINADYLIFLFKVCQKYLQTRDCIVL